MTVILPLPECHGYVDADIDGEKEAVKCISGTRALEPALSLVSRPHITLGSQGTVEEGDDHKLEATIARRERPADGFAR